MSSNVIPSDSPSVFAALSGSTNNGQSALNAIAYPSPFPGGVAGLIFDWIGEERLELRSDITDSYVEDNTAVNDQMALNPERFTLDASTAEIVFAPSPPSPGPPQPANPFPLNTPLVPTLTPGAAAAATANSAPSAAAAQGTGNLWQFYQGQKGSLPSRQAIVMGFIYQLWLGRVLFTVETPWGIFDSMAIELADIRQPEESTGRTDFKVTFKKFRIAGDPAIGPTTLLGRSYNQAAEADPNLSGNIGQTPLSMSQSQQIIGNWTLLGNASGN